MPFGSSERPPADRTEPDAEDGSPPPGAAGAPLGPHDPHALPGPHAPHDPFGAFEPREARPAWDPQHAVADGHGEGDADPVTLHWRNALLLAAAFATVMLASATMLVPVPFVVLEPGPAINTLGKEEGQDLITVKGRTAYPAKGALDLTTVTVSGGPGARLSVYRVIDGWLRDDRAVVPLDVLYPPGQTVESSRAENKEEMVSSQESATMAALKELDIPVPTTITVDSVDPGTPPSTLRAGDVILAVQGRPVPDLDAMNAIMKGVTAGDPVRVTVRRGGAETTVTAPTRNSDGRTILGIRVDPEFKPPFEVTIRIGNVGGPSAGMMFALGIVDVLTPGDLTGGRHVAGTGTITQDGTVGAIGGIQQKLVGARRAGAGWFLAPAGNCDEVVGHVPDGLQVVRVATLAEAHRAVQDIAADRLDALPRCS